MVARPSHFWSLLLLAFFCTTGCNRKSNTIPIHGNVTFRSRPVANAGLTFFPEQGRPVSASVDNGAYQAEVPAGEYVVTVTVGLELPAGYKEGDPLPPPKVTLPEQYSIRTKSTLKATVTAGQDQPIDFELK